MSALTITAVLSIGSIEAELRDQRKCFREMNGEVQFIQIFFCSYLKPDLEEKKERINNRYASIIVFTSLCC
jgi:hypothetical protein